MEFCHFFLFVMFVVLTVDQFVKRGNGPLELQKQDSHSDFSSKSQEMCQFFEKRGYPASVIHLCSEHFRPEDFESQF